MRQIFAAMAQTGVVVGPNHKRPRAASRKTSHKKRERRAT